MNIALVDDHAMVSDAIKSTLSKVIFNSDVRIFTKPKSFLTNDFDLWNPDIVISDVVMPEISGLEMYKLVKPLLKNTSKFIFLSAISNLSTIKKAIKEGAHGYVSKESSLEELLLAIETVQSNKQYISLALKDDLLSYMFSDEQPISSSLSPREKEVLQKLCDGRTTKEIAFDLHLSVNTVQLYNNSILRKFKLHRTVDVIRYAISNGLYER